MLRVRPASSAACDPSPDPPLAADRNLPPVSPTDTRFTIDGSHALEAHLNGVCEHVIAGMSAFIPKHRLDAVVLGGGYGRGQGGVLKTANGDRPYNDLEFYVFMRGHRLWNEHKHADQLRAFGEQLSPQAGLHVEFKIDSLARLRRSEITMFSYDLVSRHRVIWAGAGRSEAMRIHHRSDKIFSGCEHHLAAAKIPLSEATRLLFNRCTGLLLAKEFLRDSELNSEQRDFIGRNLAKARLALGDVVLTAFGRYHWDCRERNDRLSQLTDSALPWLTDVQREHCAGLEFKLHPQLEQSARQELVKQHRELCSLARQVWLWLESWRLAIPLVSVRDYTATQIKKCFCSSTLRNLVLNARTFGLAGLFDRMAGLYPRERLLNSLPLLLWEEPLNDLKMKCHLQNQLRTAAWDWQSFVTAYKSIWPRFS